MKNVLKAPFLYVLICLLQAASANAQNVTEIKGVMATGSMGVSVSMAQLQQQSDGIKRSRRIKTREEQKVIRHLLNHPSSPAVASYPAPGIALADNETTQQVHSNFQAISLNESGSVPPDCMGDLSETQICIASNGRLKFYAKPSICDAALNTSTTSGTQSFGSPQFSIDLDVFFSSVRNNEETTDPQVYYDRLSARWFIVCINVAERSNRMLIAVSNTTNITASTSFTFYFFTHDQGTGTGDSDYRMFGDFPMVAVDKNALYIGALIFNSETNGYVGSSCYVIRKSSIIGTGPLVFTAFRRVGNSASGIFGPNPASNDDPQATRGYFVGVSASTYGVLHYVIINDPGGAATSVTGSFTVPTTNNPIDQVAKGSDKPLDSGDDRILQVHIVKNKLTGINTLWTAHNIAVNASGVASSQGGNNRNAVRWYELNLSPTAVSLKQSGTWYDNAAGTPRGFWMGSITANGQGHALAGASAAGSDLSPNVVIAGRYNGQTAGQLSNTVFATNFSATYNVEKDDTQRWGDYSQAVVDPSDNMTIWTFQEYANGTNAWGERALQLKAPPPATPVGITPIICNDQKQTEVILSGQSVNNSGFFDPGNDAGGPGFSKHLRVTSTGNVGISNVVFENPTSLRFMLNYAVAVPATRQTLTITNPDCQSVTFDYTLPAACDSQSVTRAMFVFPNPATSAINILLSNNAGQVRLFDATGRLMSTQTVTSNFIVIPTNRLARGIYIVDYRNGTINTREKILVEK